MKRWRWLLVPALVLAVVAAGLALGAAWASGRYFVDADQPTHIEGMAAPLVPGQPIGQTFVARHGGLSGIEFFLASQSASPVSLTLHLRESAKSRADLLTAHLTLPPGTGPSFYRFEFPPVADSHARYYYAFLEAADPGALIEGAGGATYIDGAAYADHEPLDGQTAFRLVYSVSDLLLELGSAKGDWVALLLLAALLFVVPGWALLAWMLPGSPQAWPVKLGLAVGLSLALYPMLLLWANLIGLSPGSALAWLPIALGLLLLGWKALSQPPRVHQAAQTWVRSDAFWPDLTLILALVLIFVVRLLVVRTMETALWGDSYQHTVMTQLLLEHGGLFDSWQPYTPYESLTVHFGFPTAAAVLAWVSGKSSVEAVLLTGQLMNGFAALALYPLAVRIAKGNRWAGVGAVLTAGLLSPMPAFYVNWGRFAQLAGQVVLPVAIWLMWEAVERRSHSWRVAAIAGLALGGMALSYYRMPLYYAAFGVAWLLGWGVPRWKVDARSWLRGLARLLPVGAVALLLLVPLVFRVAGGRLAAGISGGISRAAPLEAVVDELQAWRNIEYYVPRAMLIAAAIGLVLGLLRRSWMVVAVGLWLLILAALPAGSLIRLPGANFMQAFAVLIAIYIPVSLLIGWLVGQVANLLNGSAARHALTLALMCLALWGASTQVGIVEPERILVTRPDTQAMAWIRQNTPEDSFFLVEGYYDGGYSLTGSDAGWWIPLLAGRSTNMPPQYAHLSEQPVVPGYSQALVGLVTQLETDSPGAPEGIRALCDWGFTHVYIGQGQGLVGYEARRLFSEEDLAGSPAFHRVYKQDRVSIYALDPEACRSLN